MSLSYNYLKLLKCLKSLKIVLGVQKNVFKKSVLEIFLG